MDRRAGWKPGRLARRGVRPLRYLLIWPLITDYRGWVRRSLRWRLAGSHVGAVLISIAATALLGAIVLVSLSLIRQPMAEEPANEARWIAEGLQALSWNDALALAESRAYVAPPGARPLGEERITEMVRLTDEARAKTSVLLEAMATGEISPNVLTEDVDFTGTVGAQLANIRSIAVVGRDHTILASSEGDRLRGRSAMLIGPSALGLAEGALNGSTSLEANTRIVPGIGSVTGAFPLRNDAGLIFAAVVVDKSARTLPSGWGFMLLLLKWVGQIFLTGMILIGVPAIPIGAIIGFRRARAISRPVSNLAVAADAIAEQQFDTRVRVDGEDEIAILGRRFNEMADRLHDSLTREAAARERAERLLAANRELVANVSHELRTPVALVRAHIESLASDPARVEEYTRIALRETDRLETLVNDLFQLARIESTGFVIDCEPFDAGSAVREATDSLVEPARRDAELVLRTAIDQDGPDDLRCLGDRARVVQILQNLIRNAIRFTPEGGMILVGARAEDGEVLISVQDTGVGIPTADLPFIFDRFYRGEQSRNRSHGGAGLGLAIARRLVEAMAGTLTVESDPGEGTNFIIRLPCPEPELPAATNGHLPREHEAAGRPV